MSLRRSTSTLIAVILLAAVTCSAQAVVETRIGDVLPISLGTPHPYARAVNPEQPTWSAPVHHKGAAMIKAHLREIDLAPGDYIVVRNRKGQEVDRVTAKEGNALGEMWVLSVIGDTAFIELWTAPNGGGRHGFIIDRYASIWNMPRIPLPESQCLTNDRERIACYHNSPTKPESVYQHSRAVCGMARFNATAAFCTGALASRDGLFFTCNHCVGTQSSANSLEVWFDYEHASCSGSAQLPTIRIRGPHKMVWTSNCNDASLIRLNQSAVSTTLDIPGSHEYILNEVGKLTLGEQVWLPGHPGGRPKEVSYIGNPKPTVQSVAKVIKCSPAQNFFGHVADTIGGNSGSTVFNWENKRIGVHGYAGCRTTTPVGHNGAARMDLIWPMVKSHFGDWNETIRVIPDGDDRTTPVGGGTPIPFGTAEARSQTLLLAADIGRKGLLEEIALASTSLTTIKMARLQIRMAHTASTLLSATFSQNMTGAVTVHDGPLNLRAVNDGWVKLGLATEFDYNGRDNLVIEYRVKGLTGGTAFHSAWKGGSAARPIRNYLTGTGAFDGKTASVTNEPAGMKHRLYFAYRPGHVTVPDGDAAAGDANGVLLASTEARYQWFLASDAVPANASIAGLSFAGVADGVFKASTIEVRMVNTTLTASGFSSSFAANLGSAVTVFSSTNFETAVLKGQWHGFDFGTTFKRDPRKSLVIELRYKGGSGGARCYRASPADPLVRRAVRVGTGAYSATTATSVDGLAPKLKIRFGSDTRVNAARTASVGKTLNFSWSAKDFGGKTYLGAAAFGTNPGIVLPGDDGRILPLNPDPLFFMSRFTPSVFVGFDGKLDSTGSAAGQVKVANVSGLAGIAFYLGVVVVDTAAGVPNGIADVSDAARVLLVP
jgi:hypothetical protein